MREGKILVQDAPDHLMTAHRSKTLEDVFLHLCLREEAGEPIDEAAIVSKNKALPSDATTTTKPSTLLRSASSNEDDGYSGGSTGGESAVSSTAGGGAMTNNGHEKLERLSSLESWNGSQNGEAAGGGIIRFSARPTSSTQASTMDYRCEVGRFLVSANCVTISNPDLLSSSETGVNLGTRS
jgi:hypothetical protein